MDYAQIREDSENLELVMSGGSSSVGAAKALQSKNASKKIEVSRRRRQSSAKSSSSSSSSAAGVGKVDNAKVGFISKFDFREPKIEKHHFLGRNGNRVRNAISGQRHPVIPVRQSLSRQPRKNQSHAFFSRWPIAHILFR